MPILSSVVTLQPGMYILRHPKGGLAPLVVARAPGTPQDGQLAMLSTSNTHDSVLRDGSDCIVLRISDGPVDLLVSACLAREGDPVPQLRLDQIGLDAAPVPSSAPAVTAPAALPPQPGAGAIQIGPHGISLIGHLERHGDRVAAPGQALGDPDSDLRLEGFQVMWPDRPEDVDLAYGIAIEGAGTIPVVKTGKFCGTRGAARRITEVTFALVGPGANRYQLDGAAYFTGGFQVPLQSGQVLSGPSGLEHLTALRLRAVPQAASAANPWTASARTTVFKPDPPATGSAAAPGKSPRSTVPKARTQKSAKSAG